MKSRFVFLPRDRAVSRLCQSVRSALLQTMVADFSTVFLHNIRQTAVLPGHSSDDPSARGYLGYLRLLILNAVKLIYIPENNRWCWLPVSFLSAAWTRCLTPAAPHGRQWLKLPQPQAGSEKRNLLICLEQSLSLFDLSMPILKFFTPVHQEKRRWASWYSFSLV